VTRRRRGAGISRALLALLALAGCEEPPRTPAAQPPPIAVQPVAPPPLGLAPEPTPFDRLPNDARPTHYALGLWVDPARPRFAGTVDVVVQLDRLRDMIWLHGRGLAVSRATVQPEGWEPMPARWEQVTPGGVARVLLEGAVGPGRVRIHLEYDAPFESGDQGLYVVERGGERYAFTQLEPTFARRAFPCFDEPAFKTPFEVTLHVPKDKIAIANAPEKVRAYEDEPPGWDRVVFAPTQPLPTYLVAVAVGTLDVATPPPLPPNAVRSRPLPLRGVAVKGRGRDLATMLARTGAIVDALEAYFEIPYPYDKLDLVAVPEKNGAMENPGALTFGEPLLLLDPKLSPVEQRFQAEATLAHELSHQWFGDLVTMPWWDDIWLNEAFATWMEPRIVSQTAPELSPRVRALESVHDAMGADTLASARRIRQPVEDDDDIENAFDAITYDKGGAVLAMFEQWMGPDVFRRGIHAYLAAHRHGTATSADLYAALSAEARRDVGTPIKTFVDQPGLPLVEARLSCTPGRLPDLVLREERDRPIGSQIDPGALFQIPVCVRYPSGTDDGTHVSCTLLAERETSIVLAANACPAWVMPNAGAWGYYRFSLAPPLLRALATDGFGKLDTLERMSFASSLAGAFARGAVPAADALAALAPFAADPSPAVAVVPMAFYQQVARWLEGDPLLDEVRARARALYDRPFRALGWGPSPRPGLRSDEPSSAPGPGKGAAEPPDRALLRARVVDFLADLGRDPAVRREAAARGQAYVGFGKDGALHPEAVATDLSGLALVVAAQDGGAPFFEALLARFPREDTDTGRARVLFALGSATSPPLAARARDLALDPRLHPDEVLLPLRAQLSQPETRDLAWAWIAAHLPAIVARVPGPLRSGLPWLGAVHCDRARARELTQLFGPIVASIEGGPRNLAGAVEQVELCAARRAAQEASARAFFSTKKKR
jgi:alanyl aminopeptidase